MSYPQRALPDASGIPFLARLRESIEEALNDYLAESGAHRLPRFLGLLANTLLNPLKVSGLALIAWNSDEPRGGQIEEQDDLIEPLAVGEADLRARTLGASRYLPLLRGIGFSGNGRWINVGVLDVEGQKLEVAALPLQHNHVSIGCVVVWYDSASDFLSDPQSVYLTDLSSLLTASIQAAIRGEFWTRLQRMNSLTQEFFENSDPGRNRWALEWLAIELGKIYQADGATIFLEEEDRLLPTASTDPDFERRAATIQPLQHTSTARETGAPVYYVRGQGLTGWVYENCRSLRIRDDKSIIQKRLKISREGPSHVDHDQNGRIVGQFLGAPLRFGTEVVGVVRLSRRSDLEPFTSADEGMLQFLGDLLGSALGNWRRVHRADAILESINEGIAVSLRRSNTDKIVFANPGIASLLGRSREEVEALDAPEAYAPGEYEKLLPGLRLAREDAQTKGRGEFGPVRSVLQRRDGSTVPVMISFRIQPNLLVRPATYNTTAIARDLSEVEQLAEQHERLLAFLDALDVAYFGADMEGRTIKSTGADTRITGYTPEDWKALKRSVLYERENDRVKLLNQLRQNNGKLTRHLLKLRRKGGEFFWAEVDLRLIRDQGGNETEMEGFYRDVTAQIKMQRFLNDKEDRLIPPDELFARLKQATEFQIDYTSSIGHQIQTPLGSLLGTIENLDRGVLKSAGLQKKLRPVIGQLRACSRLVRNLSYMDMVLRRERVRFQQVRLRRLVHEIKQDFATALSVKYLTLDVDLDSIRRHLDIVYGHAELLRQVLANLVDNSIKYSRPYTTIHIRASRLSGPTLDIMNRGLPIPAGERDRIFERGIRSLKAKALIPHGTGLGLWLVREILNLHRATIQCLEVVEHSHVFNCFQIIFPVTAPEPASRSVK